MKKVILYTLLLVLWIRPENIKAQDTTAQKISLSACIGIALKSNSEVLTSAIRSESAQVNLQQRRVNLLPTLNATITHGISQGRSIDPSTNAYINQQNTYANQDLSSALLLFNGMAQQNLIRESKLLYKAAQQQEQQAKEAITLNVILTYLQVLTNTDLLDLALKQQQTTLNQVERVEVLHKQGAISPNEYYDLKGQYTNDQLAVVNTKNALENSKLALAQLLNIPYNKNMQLEQLTADQYAMVYDASPEQVYQAAVEHLALIKVADLTEKSARMQIKYARSGYYPSIYLRGGLSSNFSSAALDTQKEPMGYFNQLDNNLSRAVNVSVIIPLFAGFQTRNAVSLAKLYHKQTELVAQTTRTQLQQLTAQAYFNMTAARDRYNTLTDQVNAFSESFSTANIRFTTGVINAVDYLISKSNLDKAKIYLIAARYDFILRKKVLDFYQGKLIL